MRLVGFDPASFIFGAVAGVIIFLVLVAISARRDNNGK